MKCCFPVAELGDVTVKYLHSDPFCCICVLPPEICRLCAAEMSSRMLALYFCHLTQLYFVGSLLNLSVRWISQHFLFELSGTRLGFSTNFSIRKRFILLFLILEERESNQTPIYRQGFLGSGDPYRNHRGCLWIMPMLQLSMDWNTTSLLC